MMTAMNQTQTETSSTTEHEDLAAISDRLERLESLHASESKVGVQSNLQSGEDGLCLLVFSGSLDRLLSAFVLATGAAACGMKVSMFFTFWATAALKESRKQIGKKSLVERMFGWMLPGGYANKPLSQLDMFGMGRWLMAREMKKKNVASLAEMVSTAEELGVDMHVCEMTMSLMGIREEELIDYQHRHFCGVAKFLDLASESRTTLFI